MYSVYNKRYSKSEIIKVYVGLQPTNSEGFQLFNFTYFPKIFTSDNFYFISKQSLFEEIITNFNGISSDYYELIFHKRVEYHEISDDIPLADLEDDQRNLCAYVTINSDYPDLFYFLIDNQQEAEQQDIKIESSTQPETCYASSSTGESMDQEFTSNVEIFIDSSAQFRETSFIQENYF